jgi:hypothetical protein
VSLGFFVFLLTAQSDDALLGKGGAFEGDLREKRSSRK